MGMVCGARGVGGAWDVDAILLFILFGGDCDSDDSEISAGKRLGEFGAVFR